MISRFIQKQNMKNLIGVRDLLVKNLFQENYNPNIITSHEKKKVRYMLTKYENSKFEVGYCIISIGLLLGDVVYCTTHASSYFLAGIPVVNFVAGFAFYGYKGYVIEEVKSMLRGENEEKEEKEKDDRR